jgi:NADPH:quinone reductase-like Zn-dependent oxidoreductase
MAAGLLFEELLVQAFVLSELGKNIQQESRGVSRPQRGQVVVRNLATAVNFHDILNIQGVIPNTVWPRVPFSDNCGEIISVHDDERRWKIGDKVIANFFPEWVAGDPSARRCYSVYGDNRDGFLQECTQVDSASLVAAPDHLTAMEVASFACAGLTAWRSLVTEANLRAGQTVVIQGTGGVSVFALQFAKMLGARVILLSSSDQKLERAKALGADHLINYLQTPQWDQQVIEITGGLGADLIVEVGGADTFARSVNAAALNGHISVIGVRSGFGREILLSPEVLLIKNLHVRGITVGSVEQLEAVMQAVALHGLRPIIDSCFPVSDFQSAIDLMHSQKHFGKIAIDLSCWQR